MICTRSCTLAPQRDRHRHAPEIDTMTVKNAAEFFAVLDKHPNVKGVIDRPHPSRTVPNTQRHPRVTGRRRRAFNSSRSRRGSSWTRCINRIPDGSDLKSNGLDQNRRRAPRRNSISSARSERAPVTGDVVAVITKHLSIRGRVQGVGYRASFYYAAKQAGRDGLGAQPSGQNGRGDDSRRRRERGRTN